VAKLLLLSFTLATSELIMYSRVKILFSYCAFLNAGALRWGEKETVWCIWRGGVKGRPSKFTWWYILQVKNI